MLVWAPSAVVLTDRAQGAEPSITEQAQGEEQAKQERTKELDEMRRRAEATSVLRAGGAEKTPAKLVAEPVLRYSDHFQQVGDATMWVYGDKGRPVALQKIECYRRPGFQKYLYALFSLSDDSIEARWAGEAGWSSTKPGVELRVLPDSPKAATTEAGRLLQMKQSIRRFEATKVDMGNVREEMRLLPRPVYRYRDPSSGVQDGAIFGFVVNGTNPDFLVLIELRGPDVARATWHYAPVRMTAGILHVRLDGNEVWSVPGAFGLGGRFDTWLYFFPRQQQPGR
jgi:hypothetical protein